MVKNKNDRRTVLLAHGADEHTLLSIARIARACSSTFGAFVRRQCFHVRQKVIADDFALDLRNEIEFFSRIQTRIFEAYLSP